MIKKNTTVDNNSNYSEVFINGVEANASSQELSNQIKKVFLRASDNLSWLSPGQKVLLKPALNSGYPYPATTHALSLQAVAEVLEKKGARVIVADQGGVEHVLHDSTGVIKGSSKKLFEESGMSKASNVCFTALEEGGWEKDFYKYESNEASSWPDGFYLAKWVRKADHIINLPRLSTHVTSGVTLGFKNMVGLLREDSRLQFHANGAFNLFMRFYARKSNLRSRDDGSNTFFQKMTEISLALKDKLRLTLFAATKAQTTFGPDKYLFRIGGLGLVSAYQKTPKLGLVFASSDPVAAEVFALAFLTHLYDETPIYRRFLFKICVPFNRHLKKLGKENVWDNLFVSHALKLGLGNEAIRTCYHKTPSALQTQLNELLKR